MNAERFLLGLYCDDIRNEVGNKLTLVGCYDADLLLNMFPTILPKFAVYARAYTPAGKPFQKLILRLRQNEDLLGELEFPAAQLAADVATDRPNSRWAIIQAVMFISPLLIQSSGFLCLEAETEEGLLLGSKLVIRAMADTPSGSVASDSGSPAPTARS
jgi:hypothetical protein